MSWKDWVDPIIYKEFYSPVNAVDVGGMGPVNLLLLDRGENEEVIVEDGEDWVLAKLTMELLFL